MHWLQAQVGLSSSQQFALSYTEQSAKMPSSFSNGRLSARPACFGSGGRSAVGSGLQQLGLSGLRDGMLYVPVTYRPGVQAPLM